MSRRVPASDEPPRRPSRHRAPRSRDVAKAEVRAAVWDALAESGAARFPYPPHGRIPNFDGAREAALALFDHPLLAGVRRIKVNPDAPQRLVRLEALRRGIAVYLPTPRLRAGFLRLDPARIPEEKWREAASLSKASRWAQPVALEELPRLDAMVVGSVAVSRSGGRCGKGEGYADLEYGILRALGQPPLPVVTTVHPLQLVDELPRGEHDLPLHLIVTPEETIEVRGGREPSLQGIDWGLLDEEDLDAMPLLRELKELLAKH